MGPRSMAVRLSHDAARTPFEQREKWRTCLCYEPLIILCSCSTSASAAGGMVLAFIDGGGAPRLHQTTRTRYGAAGPCAVSLFSSFHPDQSLPVQHAIPPRAHLFWKMINHFKLRCLAMIMTLSYLFSWLFLRESDQN